ncbi:MAG: cation:proton antiporter [Anaerolineaceae bacterium]|nr:cation:proton antiporter [Anaerolineaceae bacterium]
MPLLAIHTASFLFVALAARQIGVFLSRYNLPYISGYLIAGIVAGPFMLHLLPGELTEELRFLDEIALAFIAFAAGSELHLKALRRRWKSIAAHSLAQLIAIYGLGVVGVYLVSSLIPFLRDLPDASRLAAALLIAAILVARSPSSAIAIVNELRARGRFTQTMLGVTVVMDVVVVLIFAFSAAVADVLLTAEGFNLGVVVLLLLELVASVLVGLLVGRLLAFILSTRLDSRLKIIFILLIGYGIFLFSAALREYTHAHLPVEILLEPLLVCMVGGFMIANFSRYPDEFTSLIEEAGPTVYVAFFTLIGVTLRLDILAQTVGIALLIFGIRLAGLVSGALAGGMAAHDPIRHTQIAWMAYVTQAGIGLGLAQEVAVEFPQFGESFVTLIVSVIVLSQLVGPPLLKAAIKRVGEAHLPDTGGADDEVRNAVILGIDGQALSLAQQLTAANWKVMLADTDEVCISRAIARNFDTRLLPEISHRALSKLLTPQTDSLVMMLNDDETNCLACELAYENFGISRLVVRLNNIQANAERLNAIGALVVDPTSAMVHLMEQFVRTPQTTELLLHRNDRYEIVQITVTSPDVDGLLLRDIHLPGDVLVLNIQRDGESIVPHGYTVLREHDEVTLVGNADDLQKATLRLGY